MLAVITTAAGRHDHLRAQLTGLQQSSRPPDRHVVVSMGDPHIDTVVEEARTTVTTEVLHVPRIDGRLPVAQARNAGAAQALTAGADTVVFLDVDCIPDPELIARYAAVTAQHPRTLLSGSVAYLPPAPSNGYPATAGLADLARPHPARPMLADDVVAPMPYELFWSLSFAVDAEAWSATGGFCERYTGYGGEDTDFAQLARRHDIEHLGVGGAWAYHQWHPSPQPPLQHLHDILRNAAIFHDRWGWWPMIGWLRDFEKLGLARYDPTTDGWMLTSTESAMFSTGRAG